MIRLAGTVKDIKSFKIESVDYYEGKVIVKRKSGTVDELIIFWKSDLFSLNEDDMYYLEGDVRSYKNEGLYKKRTKVYVTSYLPLSHSTISDEYNTLNEVTEDVFVVKSSAMRRTSSSNNLRITDLVLGKDSTTGKYYAYNAIAFGSVAKCLSNITEGTRLRIVGRLQSRTYNKCIDGETRELVTYEVALQSAIIL